MPKLKPSDTELKRRMAQGVIDGAMSRQGLDNETLAIKLHVSDRTVRGRRKLPDNFRLDQLWKLADVMKLRDRDILELFGRDPDA